MDELQNFPDTKKLMARLEVDYNFIKNIELNNIDVIDEDSLRIYKLVLNLLQFEKQKSILKNKEYTSNSHEESIKYAFDLTKDNDFENFKEKLLSKEYKINDHLDIYICDFDLTALLNDEVSKEELLKLKEFKHNYILRKSVLLTDVIFFQCFGFDLIIGDLFRIEDCTFSGYDIIEAILEESEEKNEEELKPDIVSFLKKHLVYTNSIVLA
ncbi:hypothetical protein [Aquimarina algiphila]|uniref:hypothetical protein n=1 Tax=Aquimarina algiphila TaxID=2047982 RepID=UPI00248F9F75|nr:hypothetical protein [Aquimarina algiphila]